MKTITFILCIFVCLSTTTLSGQVQKNKVSSYKNQETKVDLQRNIRLENDSKPEEIIINIEKGARGFELMISSQVKIGKLTIEVFDPNGIKEGTFSVGTQLNSEKQEIANGNIRKSFTEPLSGNWKVKIIPTKATGNIRIQTAVSEDDYYIYLPEGFSPNGDNINDILKLETRNISDTIDFKIFNRFGTMVFESQNIDKTWGGVYNGELQPEGTYYYVVRAKTMFGNEVVKNGVFYFKH
ncbi:MAG: gliding motility-associated C-terminal domain-containing protein [Prolixibacteraceae bacterium]|nr:gliding motility-associated C-terminal domain-containing protein [Prolixibacteraceae bacterium]